MKRQWKPGDVARIELGNGVAHDIALRLPLHEGGWATGRTKYVHSVHVANARPLVVIDPEDREQVKRLFDAYCTTVNRNRVDAMQAALRSLIAPPKPEEPKGLGAVVEDAKGFKYVRGYEDGDQFTHPWHVIDPTASQCMSWWKYADINAVRILSGGVA